MKIMRIFMAAAGAFCLLFTLFFGFKAISADPLGAPREEYKGIITMWQIDSFEGGTGSRKQFLLRAARGFEKKYGGVLVMVTDYTAEGARENAAKGVLPDLVSYGAGIDIGAFGEITPERTSRGGFVGDKVFAAAWCRGGYVLIKNPALVKEETQEEIEEIIISQGEYTQPLAALFFEGIRAKKYTVLPPMDAYVKFTAGKIGYFLGTQRDVIRLSNRGMEVETEPLTEFNDLYQYVSVSSDDEIKRFYAEEFIKYLLSDEVQNILPSIGMLSDFIMPAYENPALTDMRGIKFQRTVSAFSQGERLKEMQSASLSALTGDESAAKRLSEFVI